jgi:cadmium resistance protein CadD (predicted permease)
MKNVATIVLITVEAFVATDIDDMVVLTILFLSFRTSGTPRPRQIVLGQFLGFSVLIGISGIAALGLAVIPVRWVGLLGTVPLALGVYGLWSACHDGPGQPAVPAFRLVRGRSGPLAIAVATVSAGGDNITIYTPLLRTLGWPSSAVAPVVLFAMLGIWCAIGAVIGTSKAVVAVLSRLGRILVPILYICIGALLIIDSGVLSDLARLLLPRPPILTAAGDPYRGRRFSPRSAMTSPTVATAP